MSVTSRPAFVSRPPTTLPIAPAPIIPILITRPPRWFDAGVRTAGPRHVVNPTLGSVFPEVLGHLLRRVRHCLVLELNDGLILCHVVQGQPLPRSGQCSLPSARAPSPASDPHRGSLKQNIPSVQELDWLSACFLK